VLVLEIVYVSEVAPTTTSKGPPDSETSHCTVGLGLPLASAVKARRFVALTVFAPGCLVTAGFTSAALTVKRRRVLWLCPESS